jgi:hypothetical protein
MMATETPATTRARDKHPAIDAAWQEVFALAKGPNRPGGRRWTMCVPPEPTDSDEVLAAGLRAGEEAIARAKLSSVEAEASAREVERLRVAMQTAMVMCVDMAVTATFGEEPLPQDVYDILHAALAQPTAGTSEARE